MEHKYKGTRLTNKNVVSADQEFHEMRGNTGVAKLGPQEWECRPEQR
jgi:hypothetical protein